MGLLPMIGLIRWLLRERQLEEMSRLGEAAFVGCSGKDCCGFEG